MGKKYIIEIEDGKEGIILCQKGIVTVGLRLENESELKPLGIQSAIPYTEPDLEAVRKEAYEKGYHAGYVKYLNKSYEDGFKDAWEAARKIICMPEGDLLNVFTECYSAVCTALQVILKYDAAEAIEKLKAYKWKQEEIKVGDIVRLKAAPEIEIWVTDISDDDGGRLSGLALKTVGDNCEIGDTYAYREIHQFERTGRHYNVAAVLEKMRGEQDG